MTAVRWLAAMALALVPAGEAAGAAPTGFPLGTNSRFALAGDRVLLWNDERPGLRVREPDGTVRVLHRAAESGGTSSVIAEAAATTSHVAFVTEGYDRLGDGGLRWSSLRTGPLDGPYRRIAGRESGGSGPRPHDVAFSDAGLLSSDDRGVTLRPADGSPPVRLGGTGGERIAVNGRYAATRTSRHAAIYDLASRTGVARLAVGTDGASRIPPSAGVTSDGTLVYIDAQRRLWSFEPSTRRRTLLMRGADRVARVAGSTVYAVRRSSGSHFEALARLWAVDLAGGEPHPVSEAVLGGEFVADGARLLYRRGSCAFLGDLTALDTAPVTAGCPRQSLSFFVDERQHRPRVRMRVTCPGASADHCTGTVRLTAERGDGAGPVVLGTWRFDVTGGDVATHTLHVRLEDVAATHRRGRSRSVARLRITGSPYGRVDRRILFSIRSRRAG